jgi:hypothetical protein
LFHHAAKYSRTEKRDITISEEMIRDGTGGRSLEDRCFNEFPFHVGIWQKMA